MANRISVWVIILASLAVPALAAPAFTEISAALAAGDGARALQLTDAGLGEANLSPADRSRLLLDRGLAGHIQGDMEGALTDLTRAIDAHGLSVPEQARAYLERGLVLDGMDRLNDAIGDYGAVLRLEPRSATALNNRANAYRRQNKSEEARRDYLASLAADNPAPEYPYYGLGQLAEKDGKPNEARGFYSRALAANPAYDLALERLAALGGTVPATQAITLRPPKSVVTGVTLHPPVVKPAAAFKPADKVVAAKTVRDDRLSLRPALEDSRGNNPGGEQVQLGAWRSEAEAAEGWKRAVAQANGALAGFVPRIVMVDLPGKGRYYRLRVVTPNGRQLCANLASQSQPCIPAKN